MADGLLFPASMPVKRLLPSYSFLSFLVSFFLVLFPSLLLGLLLVTPTPGRMLSERLRQ